MTFAENIEHIQAMAANMIRYRGDTFEVDELVNEAWIRSLKYNFTDAPLIMRRAKMDMIDYIRKRLGRTRAYCKGGIVRQTKPYPRAITNADSIFGSKIDDYRRRSIFDKPVFDKGFLKMEQQEVIDLLLRQPSPKQLEAITLYYLEDMTFREAGGFLGRSVCNMLNLAKNGISRCKEKVEEMENAGRW